MVHVIAVIQTKPGMRSKVLEFFHANTPAVQAEAGCLEYFATTDADRAPDLQTRMGPDVLVIFERWASMSDFEAHARAAHVITYRNNTRELIASRTVHVLTAV